jgi:sterol desaturase/sphingolipid hydroxylase (fatty acid hydroxylase superfamily)
VSAWIIAHEGILRASAFVATFAMMAVAETVLEARPLRATRARRWRRNLTLTGLNTVVLRLLFPAGATAAALWAGALGFGALRQISLPTLVEIVFSVVLLDVAVYAQHRLFHAVPMLFRFHQVHHADVDFDVTLGSRFHPVEMLLSMAIKLVAVVLLGASAAAVVVFELVLASSSLFNHANVKLPPSFDGLLRWLVVTPAMHVVHHSAAVIDRDSNFGFCIPWWDRLFRTYRERTAAGEASIGMQEHPSSLDQTVHWMLTLPFRAQKASVSHSYQEAA